MSAASGPSVIADESSIRTSPVPSANNTVRPWWLTTCPGSNAGYSTSVRVPVPMSSTRNPVDVDTRACLPSATAFSRLKPGSSILLRSSRVVPSST